MILLGRRYTALAVGIAEIITWILHGITASSFSWLVFIARALLGFSMGLSGALCSMYIMELSPDGYREIFGVFHQIFIGIGGLSTALLGIVFRLNVLCYFECIVTVLHCGLLFTIPDSPAIESQNPKDSIFFKGYLKEFLHVIFFPFARSFTGYVALISWLEPILNKANVEINHYYVAPISQAGQVFGSICAAFLISKIGMRKSWIISGIWSINFFTCLIY